MVASSRAENSSTGAPGYRARNWLHSSTPSTSGMCTSQSTTSGSNDSHCANAAIGSLSVPTTSATPVLCTHVLTWRRMAG